MIEFSAVYLILRLDFYGKNGVSELCFFV